MPWLTGTILMKSYWAHRVMCYIYFVKHHITHDTYFYIFIYHVKTLSLSTLIESCFCSQSFQNSFHCKLRETCCKDTELLIAGKAVYLRCTKNYYLECPQMLKFLFFLSSLLLSGFLSPPLWCGCFIHLSIVSFILSLISGTDLELQLFAQSHQECLSLTSLLNWSVPWFHILQEKECLIGSFLNRHPQLVQSGWHHMGPGLHCRAVKGQGLS